MDIRKGDSISGVPLLCGGLFGRNCAVWLQVGLGYRKKQNAWEKCHELNKESRSRGEWMKGSEKSELRCCEALKRSQIKEEYVV